MNILDLASKHGLSPKRFSSAKGGTFVSPCPKCGGTDRFQIWPEKGPHGEFWCRKGDFSGDAITWLKEIEGLSCPDAHSQLGIDCTSSTCPVLDKCKKGEGKSQRSEDRQRETPKQTVAGPDWAPCEADAPADLWRQQAQRLVDWAHERLLADEKSLAYLAARGLDRAAVETFKLGLIPDLPKVNYRPRASWGLPEQISERTQKPKRLWIAPGILIPYFDAVGVHRIRIRQWQGDPRYYWLPGSGNDVVVLNPSAQAHVVVESDLDGLLVVYKAGDLVGAVPLGTCSAKPKQTADDCLQKSLSILVALDADQAGANASKWWIDHFTQAERWPVPAGKDPGEYFQDHGGDIRAWVLAGLPPAFHVTKPVPAVPKAEEPAPQVPEPEKQPELLVKLTKTRAGHDIYLCTIHPAPQHVIDQAAAEDIPLFTAPEIARMRDCLPEMVDHVLSVKRVFPGAVVEEIINEKEREK
ncbi:hypothetical protein MJO47_09230 [Desulfuromonas sp. KJ2020]|uniref:primase-helicase zinc-binding domain-containing protein n=1 Tax=Desulfuromonas sp. KJ2020 TaxID=2919173 RepID=UPI0020A7D116|nr:primase-helicase zinc-binding domain-containing protein [Desulfuromonas sp. KJ2020]MCP3177279.1 hypothetical protein [Desulfuromonas sp. KJ2020]